MKTYITIMKEQLAREIVDDKKPDLSLKDWRFILESLETLEQILDSMDTINAEEFKHQCVLHFEKLGKVTGHEIL